MGAAAQEARRAAPRQVEQIIDELINMLVVGLDGKRCFCGLGVLSSRDGRRKVRVVRGAGPLSRVIKRVRVLQDYYCIGSKRKKAITIKIDVKLYKH